MKNLKLKFRIIETFGSQFNSVANENLGKLFSESKLSKIISGRQEPTEEEVVFLCKKLKATREELGLKAENGGRNV